ncbi:MAG TPA: hypothetical protein VN461_20815 [Vicinamibacteria bacterium]|jgi:hypothetical protein|nr:hypothetical protein [Vicinamibacteria bacterium]
MSARNDRTDSHLRGPETPKEGPSRPPVDRKRTLEDVRPDIRDATRSKPRRHATAAQRQARSRAGHLPIREPERTGDRVPDRYKPRPLQEPDRISAAERAKGRAQASQPRRRQTDRQLPDDALKPYTQDGRELEVTRAQAETIHDLGRFRVARVEAIERHVFADNPVAKDQIAELKRSGLVNEHVSESGQRYLTLSRRGRALDIRTDPRQELYSGIKRPAELKHDSAVYEAYQHARQGMEKDGNSITLVRLDYELKRDIGREAYIKAAQDLRAEHKDIQGIPKQERQQAISRAAIPVATARDLPADEDGVDYPDLQIEYERPDGTIGRVNVEIVTENYKAADLAAKSGAGFQLYLPADSQGARGSPRGIHSLAEDIYDF